MKPQGSVRERVDIGLGREVGIFFVTVMNASVLGSALVALACRGAVHFRH